MANPSPPRVAVLSVHGIGNQTSDFADKFHDRLEDRLNKAGIEVEFESAYWATELEGMERRLLDDAGRLGARNGPMRRLAVQTLADALTYSQERPVWGRIQATMANALDRLYAPWRKRATMGTDPLFIVAHSLGGLVVTEYLQSPLARTTTYGLNELRGLFTCGCNIPLFQIAKPFVPPPLRNARWRNYWDVDDFLGYPLRLIPELRDIVVDVKVNVGSVLTWWNGLSHLGYWDDRAFAKKISEDIITLSRLPVAALPDTLRTRDTMH